MRPLVHYGLYGIVLGDGFTLTVYHFLDVVQRQVDLETAGRVILRYPGPPNRSGDFHRVVTSAAQARRDRADQRAFEQRIREVGEPYVLADLSERVRGVLGVPREDLPVIAFFLPTASEESDMVLVRVPPRLLQGVQPRRDLANVLCRRLRPNLIASKCPSFPYPESGADVGKLRAHLLLLERALFDLAGRSVIETPPPRGDLEAKWLVFTSREGHWISDDEYADLHENRASYRVLVDQSVPGVWHDGTAVTAHLPARYFRVLRACASSRGAFDAGAWGDESEDGKQTFQRARQAIDVRLPRAGSGPSRDGPWAMFKTVRDGRHTLYRFDPAPGFIFALIFQDEDVEPA